MALRPNPSIPQFASDFGFVILVFAPWGFLCLRKRSPLILVKYPAWQLQQRWPPHRLAAKSLHPAKRAPVPPGL